MAINLVICKLNWFPLLDLDKFIECGLATLNIWYKITERVNNFTIRQLHNSSELSSHVMARRAVISCDE